ncbi:MAG: ABC transporter ATP-binding protein [Deltaproteobacteria bacterium]|nr:ABC transporter ATP-binding protein [Deltaproteobacteria bacterium]
MSGPGHRGGHGGGGADADEPDDRIVSAYDGRLVRRLWDFIRPHRRALVITTVLLPVVTVFELAQPLLMRAAIDHAIVPRDLGGLLLLAAGFLVVLAAEMSTRYLQTISMQHAGQLVVRDLRAALFRHVQRLPAAYFDKNPVGRTLARITNDVEGVQEMFGAGVFALIGDVVTLVGIMTVMLALEWKMALITFAIVPVFVPLVLVLRSRLRKAYRTIRRALAHLAGYVSESLSGLTITQAFNQEEARSRGFEDLNSRYRAAALGAIQSDALLFSMVEMVGTLAGAALLWFGGFGIARHLVTFGTLVAFLDFVNKFFAPIRDLSAKYAVMQSAMASCERIFALLDEAPESLNESAAPRPVADPIPVAARSSATVARVAFEGVRFSYRPGVEVLRGIDFTVAPGEKVALVGPTGSGKSTVARLLLGLYPLDSGTVRVDGADLRGIPLDTLRHQIGIVLQDVFLFSRTILENIHLGDPGVTVERARAAASAVGLDQLLDRLPQRLDTKLRERGSNLSAGERQLVSFARALAFDAPILVLDEATSQVDSRTEHLIKRATDRLIEGRTVLVIAHRLATLRDVDRILVLSHGELKEQGRHDELLARDGLYARYFRLQFGLGDVDLSARASSAKPGPEITLPEVPHERGNDG